MRTIALCTPKGGVGKTATAVNLAAFLALKRSVLLVDLDPQGHCAESFAIDSRMLDLTVADALMDRCPTPEIVRPLRGQLSLLPSNRSLAIAEIELRDELRRDERLRFALEGLPYDYVIIDCPPALGLLVVNALIVADALVIPISTITAWQSTQDLFELLAKLRKMFGRSWDLRALQTFYRQGVRECDQLREHLAEKFKGNLLDTRINLNTDISKAMGAGRPITDYPQSSGYLDYKRLAEEVLRVTESQGNAGTEVGPRRTRASGPAGGESN